MKKHEKQKTAKTQPELPKTGQADSTRHAAPTPGAPPPPAPNTQSAPPAPTGPAIAVKVEYQTPEERAQAEKVFGLGQAIVSTVGELGQKYLDLCSYIRSHKVAPKLVSIELSRLGFKRSRVSEINRVAQAADDVWDQFQARHIGFKDTLELARAGAAGVETTPAAKLLVDAGAAGQEDVDAEARAISGTETKGKGKTNTKNQIAKAKMNWLVKWWSDKDNNPKAEPKVWTPKDYPGWSLTIAKTH